MFRLVYPNNKCILSIFLTLSLFLFSSVNFQSRAACRGEGFMGISSKDPIMSWVDLTSSPVYTSASTSGTSGCKNWDFPYEKYIEYVLRQFLEKSHEQFLVETVQGNGVHLEALSKITCPQSSIKIFSSMIRENSHQTIKIFKTAKQSPEFIDQLKIWIRKSPGLSGNCTFS